MDIKVGDSYKHYKNGKTYMVLAIGHDTETEAEVVVYQAQYDDPVFGHNHVWVRPKAMFEETVEFEGREVMRFQLLKN